MIVLFLQELQHWLDRRRKDIVENVRQIRDDKRRILQDQLGIITTERAKVEQECQGLEYQLEVRDITRKIGDLNAKLDTSKSVLEPRENAFLSYDYHHSNAMGQIRAALGQFGTPKYSKNSIFLQFGST